MKLPFTKMGKTTEEASLMGNRCLVLEKLHLRWRLNPHGYAKQAVENMSSEFRDEVQAGDINTSVIRIQVLSQALRRSGLTYTGSMDRGVFGSILRQLHDICPLVFVLCVWAGVWMGPRTCF